jgi:uncharacterized protein (DUF1330 family)
MGMSHLLKGFFVALAMLAPSIGHAQTLAPPSAQAASQPPGYLLVVGKTTDRAKIGAYAAALPPIYAQNDAYYLAIGGAGRGVTWLEGPWADRSIIFGKFPSRAQIDAFWWGDAYRAAIRKRDNAGVFSVVALTGTAPLMLEGAGSGYLIVMTGPRDASANQTRLSQDASVALRDGVLASGGTLLTSTDAGQFTSLEGDTLFDRFIIAAWPSLAARDAYLASNAARRAARLRAQLGTSAVASANGVPRTQAPPAAAPLPR